MSAKTDVMTKPCIKCGRTERALNGQCKPCKRERMSAALKENPEKFKARRIAFRNANPEKFPERRRVGQDLKKVKENKAKWLDKNREKHNATARAWTVSHPERVRIFKHNRRAREREAGGRLSSGLMERLFRLQRGKCACCGKPLGDDYHLDHMMPIALGGANEDSNMQLLTQRCNKQKWKKHPVDFMQARGFLL